MSAAEKLGVLDEGMGDNLLAQANYYFGPGARTAVSRESVATYQALAKYRRALPLIVAVVDGMERIKKLTEPHPSQAVIFAISETALAALDEALGDVT